jgi:hypothetical protein
MIRSVLSRFLKRIESRHRRKTREYIRRSHDRLVDQQNARQDIRSSIQKRPH